MDYWLAVVDVDNFVSVGSQISRELTREDLSKEVHSVFPEVSEKRIVYLDFGGKNGTETYNVDNNIDLINASFKSYNKIPYINLTELIVYEKPGGSYEYYRYPPDEL